MVSAHSLQVGGIYSSGNFVTSFGKRNFRVFKEVSRALENFLHVRPYHTLMEKKTRSQNIFSSSRKLVYKFAPDLVSGTFHGNDRGEW